MLHQSRSSTSWPPKIRAEPSMRLVLPPIHRRSLHPNHASKPAQIPEPRRAPHPWRMLRNGLEEPLPLWCLSLKLRRCCPVCGSGPR
jgi:hypothetical protein